MEVVPCICSACGVEFHHREGGQCVRCGGFFCTIDLYEIEEDSKTVHVCEACRGNKHGKRGKNEVLSVRRKLVLMGKK